MAVSSIIFGFFVGSQVEQSALKRIQGALFDQSLSLADSLSSYLDTEESLPIKLLEGTTPGVMARITIVDSEGKVLADTDSAPAKMMNQLDRPEIVASSASSFGFSLRYSDALKMDMVYVAIRLTSPSGKAGFLRLALPYRVVDDEVGTLRNMIYASGGAIGLGLLMIAYYLAYRLLNPIAKVTRRAYAIAQQQYQVRLPNRRFDIGQLSEIINEIALGGQQRIDELTKNRNQLAAVLSGLTEGVIAFDLEQRVLHINNAALSMLSLNVEQALNRNFYELPASRQIKTAVEKCLSEQSNLTATVKFGERTFECCCLLMTSDKEEPSGGIMVLEDITEKMHLEKVRSDFVANASHELKTPISAIRGLVETIIDDPRMPEEVVNRFINRINSQAIRLDAVVQDLLHLSRFDSAEADSNLSRIDLAELARKIYVTKSYDAGDAGLDINLKIESEPLEVDGDSEALNQLIANLVDNAIKYNIEEGKVEVRLYKKRSSAFVEVEDSGIGISAEETQRIFERFYRVDKARAGSVGGTGLGLAIVKHIAQAHKGGVSVDSQLGKGSVFSVNIPLAEQEIDHAVKIS